MPDELLPPGRMTSGIRRRGDQIWRPTGPWTPAVHEYLRHLEAAGFDGAPRVLGTDGEFEILTYIEGEVAADPHWRPGFEHHLPGYAMTAESLRASAVLLRQLHDAAAGFVPERTSYRFHPHRPLPGEIICHGDVGPWNTVYRDGLPVAFIDFDGAAPARPLTDLASAAWSFVPLAPWATNMADRLADFVTAYGLVDPAVILPELARCRLSSPAMIEAVAPDVPGMADKLEHTAGELRWIESVLPDLARALRLWEKRSPR
jgi:Ser/Thr protein kinase RdoA (MazF antagonist)